ncbi:MAG TPA: hypothetical protein VF885_07425 [Arthrobacter sp.]
MTGTAAPAPATSPGLSRTLTNSIWLMVSVTAVSVFLLLFASFEGKVPRITGTFLVFGLFTVFAALDAREEGPAHRGPIAQVGNTYMLSLTLVYMWGSLLVRDFSDSWLVAKALFLMVLIKAGIFVVQRVSDLVLSPMLALSRWARAAAVGLGTSTVLLTIKVGTDFFLTFSDLYWRAAYAVFSATGLAVAVTALLYFAIHRQESLNQPPAQDVPMNRPPHFGERPQPQPVDHRPAQAEAERTAAPAPAPAQPRWQPAPQYTPPAQELMPWPLMPDGRTPVPKTPNGRPDWNALQHVVWIHSNAEQQWFPTIPNR